MITRTAPMIFACLALSAACAETGGRWENADRPRDAWAGDESACRRAASEQAEREFAVDRQRGPSGYSRTRAYTASMNIFEAEKREAALFERCMTANGYVRVERTPGPD